MGAYVSNKKKIHDQRKKKALYDLYAKEKRDEDAEKKKSEYNLRIREAEKDSLKADIDKKKLKRNIQEIHR